MASCLGNYTGHPNQIRLNEPGARIPAGGIDIPIRLKPDEMLHFSPKDVAQHMVVFIADLAEQMTPVISYLEVYHELNPTRLFPGQSEPAVFYHMFSKMARMSAPYLDNPPPIFDHCTALLEESDEIEARDAYWKAVQGEHALPGHEQESLFRAAARHNPHK